MKTVSLFRKEGNKIVKGSSLCFPSEDNKVSLSLSKYIYHLSLQEAAALNPTLQESGKLADLLELN